MIVAAIEDHALNTMMRDGTPERFNYNIMTNYYDNIITRKWNLPAGLSIVRPYYSHAS